MITSWVTLAKRGKKNNNDKVQSHYNSTCILNIAVIMDNNGSSLPEFARQRDPQTQKEVLPDTLSQRRRLIASLYPEMEEQRAGSGVQVGPGELRIGERRAEVVRDGAGGGVAQSLRWRGGEVRVKGAVRSSQGKRPWAFDCEKSFSGKTPSILYLFVSEIFICHAGRFIMGLSVSSAHSRVRTCCPEHPLWISRE